MVYLFEILIIEVIKLPIKITFPNSQVKKQELKTDPVEDYYPRLKTGLSYEPPKPKKKTVAELSEEVELL